MVPFHLDIVNADRVAGWCLDPDPRIVVLVEGREVGTATCRLPRPDVADVHKDVPHAATSGFAYHFKPGDLPPTATGRATVEIQLAGDGWRDTRTASVAVPDAGRDDVPVGPFPAPVLQLLVGVDADLAAPDWPDDQMLAATDALAFLAHHGSKTLPGLNHYLSWVLLFWTRVQYAERNFPRVNHARLPSDKDGSGVQSSSFEMLAIAHHIVVLDSHRVAGDVLEFGCFKGFSTSMLSAVGHELGRHLQVFDSFAGLPPSPGPYYRAGDFAGALDEVRRNVGEFGYLDTAIFHPGFFSESVPRWERGPAACLWMDVDLESSARDALQVFDCLDPSGVLFSHECVAGNFIGRHVTAEPSSQDVVVPIMDAFRNAGRPLEGRFMAGNTGAFWAPGIAPAVLAPQALERVLTLARSLA